MKKVLSLILALALCLGLCCGASAETTRLVGHCGYNLDYPSDMLDVFQYGLSAIFTPVDDNVEFNVQIRANDTLTADPVFELEQLADEYAQYGTGSSDVSTHANAAGAQIWSLRYTLLDGGVCWDYIIQQDGREFDVNSYMNSCEDVYLNVVENMLDSFTVDPNGDFSGYNEAEEEEDEPDYYTMMTANYDAVLQQLGQAVKEGWDVGKLLDNGLCPLLNNVTPEEIMVDFINLTDGEMEDDAAMLLYTANEATDGIDLLCVYVRSGDSFRCLVSSSDRDQYSLMKDADARPVICEDASNSAFQGGTMYYHVNDSGELELITGTVYDAEANAESPWFITSDTDWDVSNDTACTEEEYNAVGTAYVTAELDGGITMADYLYVGSDSETES